MNDLDSQLIALIAHGETDNLLKMGFKLDWIEDNDAKVVFRAATEMVHRTPPIKPSRLNLLSTTWGELKNTTEVKKLVSLNGTGESPSDVITNKIYNRFLATEARKIESEIHNLITQRPHETQNYLPLLAQKLEGLASTGKVYNPTPSAHKGSIVAPVLFKSRFETINRIFEGRMDDGGGWRAGHWAVILGVSGQGKSTLAYTSAVDGISQNRRVVFICKEKQSSVRARVLLGLTGLTIKEIETETAIEQEPRHDEFGDVIVLKNREGIVIGPWHDAKVRQKVFDTYSAKVDKLMYIYPWAMFSKPMAVKSIISAVDPDILNADYFDVNDVSGTDKVSGLGKIAQDYENIAHETETHINGDFQISNAERIAYAKNDRHEISGPYGSGMVYHTADTVIQTKKWREPDTQHIRRTKCRAGGQNDEFPMRFDKYRWIFVDL